ncbi:hypothetical protein [Streptomyces sp. NPDC008137]|uniref:hypothetical protein n=1 Tax=Streptomyces sp. NPDC008137 TaxID=3364813 RepID=UPI0036EEAAE4
MTTSARATRRWGPTARAASPAPGGRRGRRPREHQRFIFRWAFATTLVMTAGALATGALSL